MTGALPPEPRTEDESLVAFRLGLLEAAVKDIKTMLEEAQIAVLKVRVASLETSRNRMIAALTGLALLLTGAIIQDWTGGK